MNRREFLKASALFGAVASLAAVGVTVGEGEEDFAKVYGQDGKEINVNDGREFFYDIDDDEVRAALILDGSETIDGGGGVMLSFSVDLEQLFKAVEIWDSLGNRYRLNTDYSMTLI